MLFHIPNTRWITAILFCFSDVQTHESLRICQVHTTIQFGRGTVEPWGMRVIIYIIIHFCYARICWNSLIVVPASSLWLKCVSKIHVEEFWYTSNSLYWYSWAYFNLYINCWMGSFNTVHTALTPADRWEFHANIFSQILQHWQCTLIALLQSKNI